MHKVYHFVGVCLCFGLFFESCLGINSTLQAKWIYGSPSINILSVYGRAGQVDSINVVGSRCSSNGWFHTESKEYYLFGGYGYSSVPLLGYLNDLWKRDAQNNWIYLGGSKSHNNGGDYNNSGSLWPRSRAYSISWFNTTNNSMWLFGGETPNLFTSAYLNDLWMFNGTRWTLVEGTNARDVKGTYNSIGSTGIPGSRKSSGVSFDSVNNITWLFGGYGYGQRGPAGVLNDLWIYNGTWIWKSGSSSINSVGSISHPGARENPFSWVDERDGSFYVFGGRGFSVTGNFGYLNDVWRYNDSTGWEFIGGSYTPNSFGQYGVVSNSSIGARYGMAGWVDKDDFTVYIFGGVGYCLRLGALSDIWMWKDGNWTFMGGKSQVDQLGVYIALGVFFPEAHPGGRSDSMCWYNQEEKKAYLFGGIGYGAIDEGRLNDSWEVSENHTESDEPITTSATTDFSTTTEQATSGTSTSTTSPGDTVSNDPEEGENTSQFSTAVGVSIILAFAVFVLVLVSGAIFLLRYKTSEYGWSTSEETELPPVDSNTEGKT